MRFREVLKEVPISDIQPMGDPDPEIDQDYADEDEGMYKAWTEPEKRDWLSPSSKAQKWRAGVVKSWSKTKNNYLIIPVFGEEAYNYENLEKGLSEILRVLKKGGLFIILETSVPKKFPFKQGYHLYSKNILPLVGTLFSKDKVAYNYLSESASVFPYGEALNNILRKTGFIEVQHKPQTFGVATIYSATK